MWWKAAFEVTRWAYEEAGAAGSFVLEEEGTPEEDAIRWLLAHLQAA